MNYKICVIIVYLSLFSTPATVLVLHPNTTEKDVEDTIKF